MQYPTSSAAKTPGRTLLLVSSILIIVFNALGSFVPPAALAAAGFRLVEVGIYRHAMWDGWVVVFVMSVMMSLFYVVVGIVGIVFYKKAERAELLAGLAAASIVLTIFSGVVSGVNMADSFGSLGLAFSGIASVFSTAVALIVPILFLIGALKNKKAHDAVSCGHR